MLVLAFLACKGDPEPTTPTTPLTGTFTGGGFLEGQFCDVQAVLQTTCVVGCHSGLVPEGDLDLETDAYGALVDAPSTVAPGAVLVVPGDPGASFLYRKITGLMGPTEGEVMPPTGPLEAGPAVAITSWIRNGAPDDCELGVVTETVTGTAPYHPPGWEVADVHGLAANLQTDGDCRSCHGVDLTGGTSVVSCDDCHAADWRTDCTFCHGGVANTTGAPPEDIDGTADPAGISFPPHPEHVAGADHAAYACTECHLRPTDVLTPGHVFDDYTARYGEVTYGAGLSRYATYLAGSCTNLYCHGAGLADDGSASATDGPLACYGCHPDLTSDPNTWQAMSGRHKQHLDTVGVTCADCHSTVVAADQTVIGPQWHVDGVPDVAPVTVLWNGATCTGTCHGHDHANEGW